MLWWLERYGYFAVLNSEGFVLWERTGKRTAEVAITIPTPWREMGLQEADCQSLDVLDCLGWQCGIDAKLYNNYVKFLGNDALDKLIEIANEPQGIF